MVGAELLPQSTFVSYLLEKVNTMQREMQHLEYMSLDNRELRLLLQTRGALVSQMETKREDARILLDQEAMLAEDMRQALMYVHTTCVVNV
jgi:flagellar biosynthesis/type III secretory pathway chaperone